MMSYQAHQSARQGLVPGIGPGNEIFGMSDMASDQAAGTTFIWSATRMYVAKFPMQDRILSSDIPALESLIANYISSTIGWTPSDVQAQAAAIFNNALCPANISGDEHIKNITNVGSGYRLNQDTLNAAGAAIGAAISNYRMLQPTGVAGVTNTITTAISGLFGSPVVVIAFGAGAFILYKFWRSKHPAAVPAKAKR